MRDECKQSERFIVQHCLRMSSPPSLYNDGRQMRGIPIPCEGFYRYCHGLGLWRIRVPISCVVSGRKRSRASSSQHDFRGRIGVSPNHRSSHHWIPVQKRNLREESFSANCVHGK
ncbi:hypothetical protein AMTRI_Chr13g118360 [Amborella trichopoda]